MNRHHALAIILIAGFFASSVAAQKQPYDQLMKEIGATFNALKKDLDSNAAAAAGQDAAKLEVLFKDVEAFWTPFKTRDALEAAKGAQETAAAIASAAQANDVAKATKAYGGMGKYCAGCHGVHREQMPDKTFKIKP